MIAKSRMMRWEVHVMVLLFIVLFSVVEFIAFVQKPGTAPLAVFVS